MTLPEYIVESASRAFSRKVWLLDPPDGVAEQLAIFFDGEFYVQRMNAPSLLYELQSRGEIPKLACVFVSHEDSAARHRDLTCSRRFADFVVHDLMPWLYQRHPQVAVSQHFVGGASLGGLAAADLAITHPQIFSRCLSQSGSFWWNEEWLTAQLPRRPRSQTRFWISVGDQETATGISHPPSGLRQEVTQIAACQRFAEALSARQNPVHYQTYRGGHEFAPWQAELPDALNWLFGKDGE